MEEMHFAICDYLMAVHNGRIQNLCINMPPRAGKSTTGSQFFPQFSFGARPYMKFIGGSYDTDKAKEYSEEVRNAIRDSDEYQAIFPKIQLDSKGLIRWTTKQGGIYHALGISKGAAGKGFNLSVLDDPLSEQYAYSETKKASVRRWYGSGFRTRAQPEWHRIVLIMTRWATDDLQGHVLDLERKARKNNRKTEILCQANGQLFTPEAYDKWTVLKIPAFIDERTADLLNKYTGICQQVNQEKENAIAAIENRAPKKIPKLHYKPGDSFAPRRFSIPVLQSIRGTMTDVEWSALYMQEPVPDRGNIFKTDWWVEWPEKELPKFEMIVQTYDTAFKEGQENDYSARTTWGVFKKQDVYGFSRYNLLLLEHMNKRLNFPELRHEAFRSAMEYRPNVILVEDKASGQSLIQELRMKDLPVKKVKFMKNESKLSRAHSASPILEQGAIHYIPMRWSKRVISQCAQFPMGDHDDIVDTCIDTWLWLRRRFWVQLADDAINNPSSSEYSIGEDWGDEDEEDYHTHADSF